MWIVVGAYHCIQWNPSFLLLNEVKARNPFKSEVVRVFEGGTIMLEGSTAICPERNSL